jgi:hypothetical protein
MTGQTRNPVISMENFSASFSSPIFSSIDHSFASLQTAISTLFPSCNFSSLLHAVADTLVLCRSSFHRSLFSFWTWFYRLVQLSQSSPCAISHCCTTFICALSPSDCIQAHLGKIFLSISS